MPDALANLAPIPDGLTDEQVLLNGDTTAPPPAGAIVWQPVTLTMPIERPAAYSLQSADASGRHWMRLPLPGQDITAPGRSHRAPQCC